MLLPPCMGNEDLSIRLEALPPEAFLSLSTTTSTETPSSSPSIAVQPFSLEYQLVPLQPLSQQQQALRQTSNPTQLSFMYNGGLNPTVSFSTRMGILPSGGGRVVGLPAGSISAQVSFVSPDRAEAETKRLQQLETQPQTNTTRKRQRGESCSRK